MTTTAKRNLKLFCLDVLTFIFGFGGFLLLVGSAGALERMSISEGQMWMQSFVAFGMMFIGLGFAKFRVVLKNYYRRLNRNINKR